MTAHPRLPDGPCPDYERAHAALPGKGPAEIRAEMGIHDPECDYASCLVCFPDQASDPFEGIPNADDRLYLLTDGRTPDEAYRDEKAGAGES